MRMGDGVEGTDNMAISVFGAGWSVVGGGNGSWLVLIGDKNTLEMQAASCDSPVTALPMLRARVDKARRGAYKASKFDKRRGDT